MANKYVFQKIATAVLCMVMVQVIDLVFYFVGDANSLLSGLLQMVCTIGLCAYAFLNVVAAFKGESPTPVSMSQIREAEAERMAA